ncbi:hypothetical protein CVS40_4833 [Lucilia cuprina]|nr:hypothetical protein CVS40_4833 [Lucilia cuprina]
MPQMVKLQQDLKDADKNALIRTFITSTTKWNFNPPASPHILGARERMVRSVKCVLYKISNTRCPNDEVLRSMMVQIENVINYRPLTYIPIENVNMEALTLNHFLVGSSSGLG